MAYLEDRQRRSSFVIGFAGSPVCASDYGVAVSHRCAMQCLIPRAIVIAEAWSEADMRRPDPFFWCLLLISSLSHHYHRYRRKHQVGASAHRRFSFPRLTTPPRQIRAISVARHIVPESLARI
jgi:hypothetical protein